jgi:hypothetical protein
MKFNRKNHSKNRKNANLKAAEAVSVAGPCTCRWSGMESIGTPGTRCIVICFGFDDLGNTEWELRGFFGSAFVFALYESISDKAGRAGADGNIGDEFKAYCSEALDGFERERIDC